MTTFHRRCTNCGSDVLAKNAGGVIFCECCRDLQRAERRQRRILNARQQIEYVVVSDPVPVEQGGFEKGARITAKELDMGIRAEYRSFNVGTILQAKSGVKFLILNRRSSNAMRLQRI